MYHKSNAFHEWMKVRKLTDRKIYYNKDEFHTACQTDEQMDIWNYRVATLLKIDQRVGYERIY